MSFLFYHHYLEICFSRANTEMKESMLKNGYFMENHYLIFLSVLFILYSKTTTILITEVFKPYFSTI